MIFKFFQASPIDQDDDIATGTYPDGAIGMPSSDPSSRMRDRSRTFRRRAHDHDYGVIRAAGQSSAGLVP